MLVFEDEPLYNMVDFDIWFDITEGYYLKPWYTVKFDCRFHFWLVLIGVMAEEGNEEQQYLNHKDYMPAIRKTDEYHWVIGVQKNIIDKQN